MFTNFIKNELTNLIQRVKRNNPMLKLIQKFTILELLSFLYLLVSLGDFLTTSGESCPSSKVRKRLFPKFLEVCSLGFVSNAIILYLSIYLFPV